MIFQSLTSGAQVETSMVQSFVSELSAIIQAAPVDKLRFLTADRWRAYLALLWILLRRRRSHEIEVYYDDLMSEACELVPEVQPGILTPESFRADVNALEEWGNLPPKRLEPRRIQTLADRRLQKFLCRLDEETIEILEFLEARPARVTFSDHGQHFLRDAVERLSDIERLVKALRRASLDRQEDAIASGADDLVRLAYLCLEVDKKVAGAARELTSFTADLLAFTASTFSLESMSGIVERLERYVEDYVAEAARRARLIHLTALRLLRRIYAETLEAAAARLQERINQDPITRAATTSIPHPRVILKNIAPFFKAGGEFDSLLERVHAAARDVVRRVYAHVESVRARNIRIETLRERAAEIARLTDEQASTANEWLNSLYTSCHVLFDHGKGTPVNREQLPEPMRRDLVKKRGASRGAALATKRGQPGQARVLHRARLLRLSRFVEEKILRGRPTAPLSDAHFQTFTDFENLIESVKAVYLRAGHDRRHLTFAIARKARLAGAGGGPRARFILDSGSLDAPDLTFVRRSDHQ